MQDNRAEARASLLSLFQQKPPTASPDQSLETNQLPQDQPLIQPAEMSTNPGPPQPEQQASKDIEALFRNLGPPQSPPTAPEPPSEPVTQQNPFSPRADAVQNPVFNPTDRQNVLLSLLGTVGGAPAQPAPTNTVSAINRQTSTSPTMSGSESQGKALLESLMSGNQMTSPLPPQAPPAASPPTNRQPVLESEPPRKSQFDYVSPYEAFQAPEPPAPVPAGVTQSQPTAAPSPARKKPVPPYNPSPVPGDQVAPAGDSFHQPSPPPQPATSSPAATRSPDLHQNLLNNMQHQTFSDSDPFPENIRKPRTVMSVDSASESGRGPGSQGGVGPQGPLPPIPANAPPANARVSPIPYQRQTSQQQVQHQSPPLRPAHPPPNRASPPLQPQQVQYQQQAPRGRGSPASLLSRDGPTRPSPTGGRDSPNGGRRNNGAKPQGQGQFPQQQQQQQQPQPQQQPAQKGGRPQGPSSSLITIDVNAPLQPTLAPEGIAQVTPIALLKLEPTYLPGTTIGVANFIAYSMTRGRVRLIGRETGARALIRLPETFPSHSSVQDMAISGTRLACVTNDGGLVVWDVPGDIEDDIQSRIILHVLPSPDASRFKVVKWHPKQPNTLAVASEREIYLLQVDDAHAMFGAEGVRQDELSRISKVFSIPSPLVSFTFDVPQIAIASISVDSTITLWSVKDKLPFWTGRVNGDGPPSSIDFLEGGLVVGRSQGVVLQLLPIMSTTVLSTVRFIQGPNGPPEEPPMFGHLSYDSTLKTLWVANSARSSLFAIKVGTESVPLPPNQPMSMEPSPPTIRPSFDQIIEFPCQNSTINLTLVAAEGGEPGNTWVRDPSLAVCAFSVHAGGVDQINIERDAFENALISVPSKLPNVVYSTLPAEKRRSDQGQSLNLPVQQQQVPLAAPQQTLSQFQQHPMYAAPGNPQYTHPQLISHVSSSAPPPSNPRARTPPSDLDRLVAAAASAGAYDPSAIQGVQPQHTPPQQPGGKGKGKEAINPKNPGGRNGGAGDASSVRSDTREIDATNALTKEIRKVEENLHNKIGRLIVKELDKQHLRLEEVRHADQTADFERQEKILKLISTELTKNTTRVVETAVKSVIQNSVLPALESVTKNEVKAALNGQIAKGMADSMKQTLPTEVERLLLRPDVANHVARTFAQAITPLVERHVKESITKTLIPAYTQASNDMHQELAREIQAEMLNLRKEVVSWQSEALKGTENTIRDMEQSIRALTEQVKLLTVQVTASQNRSTPSGVRPTPQEQGHPTDYQLAQYRQSGISVQQAPFSSAPPTASYQPQQSNWMQQPLAPQPMQAPMGPPQQQQHPQQLSHTHPAPPPAPAAQPPPQPRTEDWDETFLTVLGYQDAKVLRDLLARCAPDVIMPQGQPSPLSQAVVLTLIHRLAFSLADMSPVDDSFKSSLWWLQRAALILKPTDNMIAPYVARVLQTAVSTLNTTSSRLNVIPGAVPMEINSMMGQIQQALSNLM